MRGSGGQMEAPHGSHAFKESRGRREGGGNQQPTDGKGEGCVGRGRCRGTIMNPALCCQIQNN